MEAPYHGFQIPKREDTAIVMMVACPTRGPGPPPSANSHPPLASPILHVFLLRHIEASSDVIKLLHLRGTEMQEPVPGEQARVPPSIVP